MGCATSSLRGGNPFSSKTSYMLRNSRKINYKTVSLIVFIFCLFLKKMEGHWVKNCTLPITSCAALSLLEPRSAPCVAPASVRKRGVPHRGGAAPLSGWEGARSPAALLGCWACSAGEKPPRGRSLAVLRTEVAPGLAAASWKGGCLGTAEAGSSACCCGPEEGEEDKGSGRQRSSRGAHHAAPAAPAVLFPGARAVRRGREHQRHGGDRHGKRSGEESPAGQREPPDVHSPAHPHHPHDLAFQAPPGPLPPWDWPGHDLWWAHVPFAPGGRRTGERCVSCGRAAVIRARAQGQRVASLPSFLQRRPGGGRRFPCLSAMLILFLGFLAKRFVYCRQTLQYAARVCSVCVFPLSLLHRSGIYLAKSCGFKAIYTLPFWGRKRFTELKRGGWKLQICIRRVWYKSEPNVWWMCDKCSTEVRRYMAFFFKAEVTFVLFVPFSHQCFDHCDFSFRFFLCLSFSEFRCLVASDNTFPRAVCSHHISA